MLKIVATCYACEATKVLTSNTKSAGLQEALFEWANCLVDSTWRLFCTKCATELGRLVPCPGDAHAGTSPAQCPQCAPRLGLVPVGVWRHLAEADIEAVRLVTEFQRQVQDRKAAFVASILAAVEPATAQANTLLELAQVVHGHRVLAAADSFDSAEDEDQILSDLREAEEELADYILGALDL